MLFNDKNKEYDTRKGLLMEVVSKKVSFFKSLIWRINGVIILAVITYLFTKKFITTTQITVTHHVFFLFAFYFFERFWAHVNKPLGRIRNIIKSLLYEIFLGVGFGGLIVFLYTNSFPMVTYITGTYTIVKIILYTIYDNLWPEYKKIK